MGLYDLNKINRPNNIRQLNAAQTCSEFLILAAQFSEADDLTAARHVSELLRSNSIGGREALTPQRFVDLLEAIRTFNDS